MGDDAFYSPDLPQTLRVRPRPAEPLWELRRNHITYSCDLHYHGEWGVEAQILYDGNRFVSWRFQTRALAVEWAEAERMPNALLCGIPRTRPVMNPRPTK